MRIAELSATARVPVPTIKYYLREGLLAPGVRTSPNQASYDEQHVRRLRLVRALIDIGGLSVARVGEVLAVLDAPSTNMSDLLGAVQRSMINTPEPAADEMRVRAEQQVADLLDELGWQCTTGHPSAQALASVLAAAWQLGFERFGEMLPGYARACAQIAELDLDFVDRPDEVERMLESVVVGTVLGDCMLSALRRLAQSHESERRYRV